MTICSSTSYSKFFCLLVSGPWWPLFKPSQLISSEFPEHNAHAQYRSYEQKRSYESASQESRESVPHLVSVGDFSPRVPVGVDSPISVYRNNGKQQVQWDHYSDIGSRSTTKFSIQDAITGGSGEGGISREQGLKQDSVDNRQDTGEIINDDDGDVKIKPQPKAVEVSHEEEGSSSKSEEGNFFNDGNFFQEKQSAGSLETDFLGDFEISKESSAASEEGKDTSNSIAVPTSNWYHGGLRSRGPVATSYSSMTKMFDSPVRPRVKDLLHPEFPQNDISMYVKSNLNPVSRSKFFNGKNATQQVLLHKPISGALHYQQAPPWPLPTYPHPHSSTVLRWQEAPGHSPVRRVIHHESRISHVVPTKDPFADISWSHSRKVEYLKPPPPVGKTLYLIRKKPVSLDLKQIVRRRPSNNYVYLVKNKILR